MKDPVKRVKKVPGRIGRIEPLDDIDRFIKRALKKILLRIGATSD